VRKSAYESDRTLTAKRFTSRLHPGFAGVAPAIHLVVSGARKAFWHNGRYFSRYTCYCEGGCLSAFVRMREVEKYGTGNCEMV
jgi:hypothetical protein